MPRLFIGIPLPEQYKSLLAATSHSLDECLTSTVKWTRAENAHLTLQFLGHVEKDKVDEIRQALSKIQFTSFSLATDRIGCFPHLRKPRVVWLGLRKGIDECARLAAMVNEAMAEIGFNKEEREFRSHLTLGRVKRLMQDDWERILNDAETQWPEIEISRFVLWESELTQEGPIYHVVEAFSLH